jgi:hypothetical protein
MSGWAGTSPSCARGAIGRRPVIHGGVETASLHDRVEARRVPATLKEAEAQGRIARRGRA